MTDNKFKAILISTLGVPAETKENTTHLVASINSLKVRQKALDNVVKESKSAPTEVQAKLQPILTKYVTPLQNSTSAIDTSLWAIWEKISSFCDAVAKETKTAETDSTKTTLRDSDILMLSLTLSKQADLVQATTARVGKELVQYRNEINATAAQMNTLREQLNAKIGSEKREEEEIEDRIRSMEDESIWEKLLDSFKEMFGELQEDLQSDMAQIHMDEVEIKINENMIRAIDEVVRDLRGISSVASALQIGWRNLSDSIGDLEKDMVGITVNVSPSNWNTDLEYINSDWENIKQILAKVSQ